MVQATGCLSRARTHAAARRSPVRQDQARRSPPACVRARTPGERQAGCRATLDTRPGGRAGCAPHPASAAVVRPAVPRPRLLRLAPRSIASLSLGVSQRHGNCAPLRNGSWSIRQTVHLRRAVLTTAPVEGAGRSGEWWVMASPAGSRRRYGGVPRCGRRPPWW